MEINQIRCISEYPWNVDQHTSLFQPCYLKVGKVWPFGEGHCVWLSAMPHVYKTISISNNPNIGNYM